jgi:hypothetical protein
MGKGGRARGKNIKAWARIIKAFYKNENSSWKWDFCQYSFFREGPMHLFFVIFFVNFSNFRDMENRGSRFLDFLDFQCLTTEFLLAKEK